jgi:hypothetical protein
MLNRGATTMARGTTISQVTMTNHTRKHNHREATTILMKSSELVDMVNSSEHSHAEPG